MAELDQSIQRHSRRFRNGSSSPYRSEIRVFRGKYDFLHPRPVPGH
ncbi:unnamed protein product [Oikopleura dioica]|uniref:Uncharacterized protein n=1 Tax=Oikopleura dioica TaxID=34765 RepID=E4Z5Z7_OIKDI|nr:unnamed protein product [Oikopleura dioica]